MELVRADFHTHTTFSDSDISPRELIQALLDAGVQYAAVTDHDCISLYAEGTLEKIAEELGINPPAKEDRRLFHLGNLTLLSGIELSTCYNGQNQHIVGLGMRPITHSQDIDYLKQFAETRRVRIKQMFEEIEEKRKVEEGVYAELGLRSLNIDEFNNEVGSAVPTRLHIGRYLWSHYGVGGVGGSPREAMKIAVNRNLTNYDFPGETIKTQEAINLIHNYGGIAVVPHLRRQCFGKIVETKVVELVEVLTTLKQQGVDGIETDPSDELNPMYMKIAGELDLLQSIGTDDHGTNGPTYYGSPSQDRTRVEIHESAVQAILKKLQLND